MARKKARRKKKGRKKKKKIAVPFVKHPGTKAQPYLEPALEGADKLLTELIGDAIRKVGVSNPTRLVREIDKATEKVAKGVKARAVKLVPVDTSKLKGSINVRKERILSYTVGTNVEYAEAVEKGTSPHIIFPKNKKLLSFVVKGRRSRTAKGRKGRRP